MQEYLAVHFTKPHDHVNTLWSALRALEGVSGGWGRGCLGPSVLGPAAIADWKCSVPRAQSAASLPHWKAMMVLESSVGSFRGAVMMMKITNDYMAGYDGPRTLRLVGCGWVSRVLFAHWVVGGEAWVPWMSCLSAGCPGSPWGCGAWPHGLSLASCSLGRHWELWFPWVVCTVCSGVTCLRSLLPSCLGGRVCLTLPPCWGHPVGKRWVTRHTSGEMQSLCRLKCEKPVGPEPRGHILELCSSSDSPENWRAILLGLWLWDCSTHIHTHMHTHTHIFFFSGTDLPRKMFKRIPFDPLEERNKWILNELNIPRMFLEMQIPRPQTQTLNQNIWGRDPRICLLIKNLRLYLMLTEIWGPQLQMLFKNTVKHTK